MPTTGTHIEIIRNDLPKIAGQVDERAQQLVRETVLFIEGASKSAAPIGETGALAGGIQSDIERTAEGWRGTVFDAVDYAAYVNYGTGSRGASSNVPDRPAEIAYTGSWLGMPARPFMSQAAADARPRFHSGMNKIVGG